MLSKIARALPNITEVWKYEIMLVIVGGVTFGVNKCLEYDERKILFRRKHTSNQNGGHGNGPQDNHEK
jgi:hypothetical protein